MRLRADRCRAPDVLMQPLFVSKAIMLKGGVARVHGTHCTHSAHSHASNQEPTAHTSILCFNTTSINTRLPQQQRAAVITVSWQHEGLIKVPAADWRSQRLATPNTSNQAVSIRVCIISGGPHALAGVTAVAAGPKGPRSTPLAAGAVPS